MRRALLLVALVAAVVRLPSAERDVSRDPVSFNRGVPILRGIPVGTDVLIHRVREVVPEGAPIRIVVRGTSCTRLPVPQGFGLVYWLQYNLLPHPSSCDANAEWQVYALTPEIPEGAEIVAPGIALWHNAAS